MIPIRVTFYTISLRIKVKYTIPSKWEFLSLFIEVYTSFQNISIYPSNCISIYFFIHLLACFLHLSGSNAFIQRISSIVQWYKYFTFSFCSLLAFIHDLTISYLFKQFFFFRYLAFFIIFARKRFLQQFPRSEEKKSFISHYLRPLLIMSKIVLLLLFL